MVTRPTTCAALPYDLDLIGLSAEDDFALDGLLYTPKGGASAAVLLMHGKTFNFLGGPVRFAPPALAREGITSFALNMRVHSLGYARRDVSFQNFDNFEFNMAGGAWERLEDGHKDVKAAVSFLRDLGYERIVLAGHSSGGFYCADYAGRYQDFEGLVLLSPLDTNRFALAHWFDNDAEAAAMKRQAEEMVARGEGHHLLPLRTWYYAISAASLLDRMNERPGWWDDAMRANTKPTLLLYSAEEDRATVLEEKFESVIAAKQKELVILDGAEHFYLGSEDQVTDAMVAFMRRHVM